jgi:hypothetical protein
MAASSACTCGQAAQPLSEGVAALLLAAALLAGCAADGATGSSASSGAYEFRLVSETLKDEWARERMFWVDNERLIFRADVYEGWTRVEGKRYGLYLWDERARTVRQIEPVAGGLCAVDGIVSFVATRGNQLVYVEGPVNSLKEMSVSSREQIPDRVRCRAVPRGTIRPKLLPLIGGGFLEDRRGAPERALPYRYYATLNAAPLDLPMNPLYTGPDLHRYSEYTRSHIFLSSAFDRTTRSTAVWQVFADGRTQTLALKEGPWSDGPRVPLPTTKGWLVAAALNGVYLMQGGHFERISAGQVRDTAVSPDGCRAALKMRLGGGSSAIPMQVYIVDLCNGGRAR